MLALVMVGSALVIIGLGKLFGWDIGWQPVC